MDLVSLCLGCWNGSQYIGAFSRSMVKEWT
uniref:Cytochrome b6/f complex subunit VIII n=1 Tax=Cyperus fuscus TaxID=529431 RepID=A0A6H0EYI3_9POAL|nr:cytochrome b6/f complex subunit VIII [Cyperus fuscus]